MIFKEPLGNGDFERLEGRISGFFDPTRMHSQYDAHGDHSVFTRLHESSHWELLEGTQFGHVIMLLGRLCLMARANSDTAKQAHYESALGRCLRGCAFTAESHATVSAYASGAHCCGAQEAASYIKSLAEFYRNRYSEYESFTKDAGLTVGYSARLWRWASVIAMNVPNTDAAIGKLHSLTEFAEEIMRGQTVDGRFRTIESAWRQATESKGSVSLEEFESICEAAVSYQPTSELGLERLLAVVRSLPNFAEVEAEAIELIKANWVAHANQKPPGEEFLELVKRSVPWFLPRKRNIEIDGAVAPQWLRDAGALTIGTMPGKGGLYFVSASRRDWTVSYMGHYLGTDLRSALTNELRPALAVHAEDYDFERYSIRGSDSLSGRAHYVIFNSAEWIVKTKLFELARESAGSFAVAMVQFRKPEIFVHCWRVCRHPNVTLLFVSSAEGGARWKPFADAFRNAGRLGDLRLEGDEAQRLVVDVSELFSGR